MAFINKSPWGGWFPYMRPALEGEIPDQYGSFGNLVDMLKPISPCTIYVREGHRVPMPVVYHVTRIIGPDGTILKDRNTNFKVGDKIPLEQIP